MLKKILSGLVILVVVLVVVVAIQPADFRIERSTTIAAPPSVVFAQVNDFHKWDAWSPWAKLDPAMKTTFEGPESGTGAMYSWVGNSQVGEGKMTITESKPDERIQIKLEFLKPFAATNTAVFTFTPESDGTKVVWSMEGKNNFMAKGFNLVMNMDKLVGGDFEKGLAALKSVAEASATPAEGAAPAPTP